MDRKELEKNVKLYETFRDINALKIAYDGYKDLVEKDHNDLDALWTFGVINDFQSRYYLNLSIKYLEQALDLAKSQNNVFIFKKVSFQLIEVYSRNHQTHISIEKYKKLLAEEPEEIYNYIFLIASYLKASQPNDAWKVCETALKLEPNNADVLLYAGEISQDLKKFEEAFKYWDNSIKLDDEYADARYSKAFLYRRLGMVKEAIKAFNDLAEWMLSRGYDLEAKWAYEEADKLK